MGLITKQGEGPPPEVHNVMARIIRSTPAHQPTSSSPLAQQHQSSTALSDQVATRAEPKEMGAPEQPRVNSLYHDLWGDLPSPDLNNSNACLLKDVLRTCAAATFHASGYQVQSNPTKVAPVVPAEAHAIPYPTPPASPDMPRRSSLSSNTSTFFSAQLLQSSVDNKAVSTCILIAVDVRLFFTGNLPIEPVYNEPLFQSLRLFVRQMKSRGLDCKLVLLSEPEYQGSSTLNFDVLWSHFLGVVARKLEVFVNSTMIYFSVKKLAEDSEKCQALHTVLVCDSESPHKVPAEQNNIQISIACLDNTLELEAIEGLGQLLQERCAKFRNFKVPTKDIVMVDAAVLADSQYYLKTTKVRWRDLSMYLRVLSHNTDAIIYLFLSEEVMFQGKDYSENFLQAVVQAAQSYPAYFLQSPQYYDKYDPYGMRLYYDSSSFLYTKRNKCSALRSIIAAFYRKHKIKKPIGARLFEEHSWVNMVSLIASDGMVREVRWQLELFGPSDSHAIRVLPLTPCQSYINNIAVTEAVLPKLQSRKAAQLSADVQRSDQAGVTPSPSSSP